ncbi:MAG: MotA/TolQ/ExbB proton channel family protein [Planctomycetaceae bacterium]
MYFEFQCSQCSKKLKVREENVGSKVRCPYCHTTQTIAAPPPAVEETFSINVGGGPSETTPPGPFGGGAVGRGGASTSTASAPSVSSATPRRPKGRGASNEEFVDPTQVSPWTTLVIGIGLTVGFYAIMFPLFLRGYYLGKLFCDRGWVTYATTFFTMWSLAILYMKSQKVVVQKDSMLFDLLPEEISRDITIKSVDRFQKHIQELPVRHGSSMLLSRVQRGLEHYRILKNPSEVADRLAVQSEIDANSISSSYSLLKVFIWAIPIFGFIGTVIGISDAVGGFSAGMQGAADVDAMKASLGKVTSGLSTAFDTTLVSLVFSMFVMFPMTSMMKAEEDLVNRVDEYTNENFLKRLKDATRQEAVTPSGIDPKALREAIDAALTPHHAELKAWITKLDAIGDKLSSKVAEGWSRADGEMQSRHQQTVGELGKSVASIAELSTQLHKMAEIQVQTMTALAERTAETQTDVSASMSDAANSLKQYFSGLEQGLTELNNVLGSLGGKQIVIEAQPPVKSGWSLFGRKNGAR